MHCFLPMYCVLEINNNKKKTFNVSAFVFSAGSTLPKENEGLFRSLISTSSGIFKKNWHL